MGGNSTLTTDGVCYDILADHPITIAGRQVGAVIVSIAIIYLIGSLLIIYWIKRQEANARKGNDQIANEAAQSVIFPIFVNVLWGNAIVNIYIGIITLTLSVSPYEISNVSNWGIINAYCFMWAAQHAITEGVAFLLMQKGLGRHAAKQTLKLMTVWFIVTWVDKIIVYLLLSKNKTGAALFFESLWEMTLFIFYLLLWLTPEKKLFRRPAAINYAKFWTAFRVLSFICAVVYYVPASSDFGFCMIILGPVFGFAILEPLIVYYTLLVDSKWWQGTEILSAGSHQRHRDSMQDIRSPLEGIDLNLSSAQQLASSIDSMGSTGVGSRQNVQLLNFSYIDLNKNKQLGTGSFSKVFLGKYRDSECAIKLVFTVDLTQDEVHRVWQEAQILSSLKHPNIVSIFGVSVLPPSVCILLELCSFGSLADILRNTGILHPGGNNAVNSDEDGSNFHLTRIDRLYLALGCARGLAALHATNSSLCHRDIKSFNFLVDSQLNAKVADLELGIVTHSLTILLHFLIDNTTAGTSFDKRNNTESNQSNIWGFDFSFLGGGNQQGDDSDRLSRPKEKQLKANEILANWVSPEVISGEDYTQAADIYSFALVLWEVLSGTQPFKEISKQEEVRSLVKSGGRPSIPESWNSSRHPWTRYVSLMKKCWQQDKDARPSADYVLLELESMWRGCFHSEGLKTDTIPDLSEASNERKGMYKQASIFGSINSSNSKYLDQQKVAYLVQPMVLDQTYSSLDNDKELGWIIVSSMDPYYVFRTTRLWCNMVGINSSEVIGKPLREILLERSALEGKIFEFEQILSSLSSNTGGWTELKDPATENLYYWNQETNKTFVPEREGQKPNDELDVSILPFSGGHMVIEFCKNYIPTLFSIHAFPIRQRTAQSSETDEDQEQKRGLLTNFKGAKNSKNNKRNEYNDKHPIQLFALQFSELRKVVNVPSRISESPSKVVKPKPVNVEINTVHNVILQKNRGSITPMDLISGNGGGGKSLFDAEQGNDISALYASKNADVVGSKNPMSKKPTKKDFDAVLNAQLNV